MSRRYCELPPPPDLADWVRCPWVSVTTGEPEPRWVVPDGCLDVIWVGGTVLVAGPDDGPNHHDPPAPSPTPRPPVVGVRFRPGRAGPLLREAPNRLRNRRVALTDLGPPLVAGLEERLAAAPTPERALALLVDEVRRRAALARPPDEVATAAADLLLASGGRLAVGRVARQLAVSERHLRRRAGEALGYGPKTFARIVRFQGALALLHAGDRSLAAVAAEAGYADQAHLTREVGELAGRTPAEIVAGSFKPPVTAAP